MAEVATRRAAQGYSENAKAARTGGEIAGQTRRSLEAINNTPVVTPRNFIDVPESQELPAPEEEEDDTLPF